MHLPFAYLDDRGKPLDSDRELAMADARAAGVDKATARRSLQPAAHLALACIVLGLAGVWGIMMLIDTLEQHVPKALAYAVGLLAYILVFVASAKAIEGPARRIYRRGWLGMGLCACCAYRITELRAEADGCRVCPECGSAWKLDQAGGVSAP